MALGASITERLAGKSIREILRAGPGHVRHVAWLTALRLYYRRQLHGDETARADRRSGVLDRLADAETILFCCHGNICRGPFAERYARKRFDTADLTVDSVGFIDRTDPRSPTDARTTAAKHGVDLDEHRAVQADSAAISRADLLFVMDYRNYHTFTRRFPEAADRLFLLGLFGDEEPVEIADPYGKGPAAFERTYDRIRTCIDRLVGHYESLNATQSTQQLEHDG